MECELHGNKLRVYRNGIIERFKNNSWIVAKQWVHKNGYLSICLCSDATRKHFRVHRIVAFVYLCIDINNPKLYIRPIDKNPTNTNLSNLWIQCVKPRHQKTNTFGVYYNKTKDIVEEYNELEAETYLQ